MLQKNPNDTKSVSAQGLAIFRILLGIILLVQWMMILIYSPMLTAVEILAGSGILIMCIFLILGIRTRFVAMTIACLYILQLIIMSIIGVGAIVGISESQIFLLAPLLFILAFSNADRGYSLTMYRRYGSIWEWEDVRVLPVTVLKIIVSGAYLYMMAELLVKPMWTNGAYLRSALIGSLGTRIAAGIARSSLPVSFYSGGSYLTMIICIAIVIGIWLPNFRKYIMIIGLFFHISIVILIGKLWLLALPAGYLLFLHFDHNNP